MTNLGITKVCPACGESFYRPASKADQITCSRYCRARLLQDKGETVTCKRCGAPFYREAFKVKLGFGNYCSHECWGADRKTPIGIANNVWTKYQRANWKDDKCARCGSTENLEMDHILAHSLGGKSERSNCQTLCKLCNLQKYQNEDLPTYLATKQQV